MHFSTGKEYVVQVQFSGEKIENNIALPCSIFKKLTIQRFYFEDSDCRTTKHKNLP